METPQRAADVVTNSGCDICGGPAARELYTASDRLRNSDQEFSIAICLGCGVLRTLPEMTERELSRFYPDDYWGGHQPSDEWIRSSQSEKLGFIRKCGLTAGKVLDVGCGAGFFLRALDSNRWDRFGVETSGPASDAAAQWLGGERIWNGTLADASFKDSSFDVITFWSVLEHMNYPRTTLQEASRIIKPGGMLVVQVPNAASYQARLFRGNWFALDAPRHRYHFSSKTLRQVLENEGFSIYRATFFSKAHNAHALRQSLKSVLRKNGHSLKYGLFYLSIPFIKPVDWTITLLGSGATMTVAARATRHERSLR